MITKMKKIILFSFLALTMSLFCASCVHRGDLEIEPVPTILFEYSVDAAGVGTFTSTKDGTTNITWTTSDGGTGSGEQFVYTFPKPGIYWVTMKATKDGREQSVSTKVLVAKMARVSMDDDSFDDWDKVDYEDFIITDFQKQDGDGYADGGLKLIKVDYNSDYVFFYIVWNAKAYEGGTGIVDGKTVTYPAYSCEECIAQFYIDADNKSETGSAKVDGSEKEGFGWEYMFEDGLVYFEDDIRWKAASGPKIEGKTIIGKTERDEDDVFRIEFAIDRKAFGLTGEVFSFVMVTFDDDWTNRDNTFNNLPIVINMNKTE